MSRSTISTSLILFTALLVAACESPVASPEAEPLDPTTFVVSPEPAQAYVIGPAGGAAAHRAPVETVLRAALPAATSSEVLTFFSSREAFDDAAPDLLEEDFEGAIPGPGEAAACLGPFDSQTDNDCFSPGAILEGISIGAVGGGEMAVLGPGVIGGVESTVVGPNDLGLDTEIQFTAGVRSVGVSVLAPMGGPAEVSVEVYASDGSLLGTGVAHAAQFEGVFWGVVSEEPIGRLLFVTEETAGETAGELFEFVVFGGSDAPDDPDAPEPKASDVEVLVKPTGDPSPINLASRGSVPVAVLSSEGFDATTIDPGTVRFGPGEAAPRQERGHVEDVNGDGLDDMVFHFLTQEADFSCEDTEATLTGETVNGEAFSGTAEVRILCRGRR